MELVLMVFGRRIENRYLISEKPPKLSGATGRIHTRSRKSVLIIQRRMSEYRVPLFERMRHRLDEMRIDLHVGCGNPTFKEILKRDTGLLSWSSIFPSHYWYFKNFYLVFQRIPNNILKQKDLVIVPHENSLISNYWLLLRRRLVGPLVAFWGHGANFQTSQPNSYRERLKAWISTQVDWWFAYTSLSVARILSTGFPKERITCLNNAIDVSELTSLRESIPASEVGLLKKRLRLQGQHVGVFVGSLYVEKRLGFLFIAADELKRKLPDFELVIIGDGPLRDTVRHAAEQRDWVRWVGAKHGREKVIYLSLGHVVMNPGLVGLGILDSFAMGIPMVTTDCGIHSPEIAYLDSGRNGLMVANDVRAFVEGVLLVVTNYRLRDSMRGECQMSAQHYTLEAMMDNFCDGILRAVNGSRVSKG
jgi:glycosyltransferase involved in cell wall biosynthesis